MIQEKESIVALATALACVRRDDATFTQVCAALDEVETLIFRHKETFGIENARFQQGCEEFILLCNTAAIQHLPHAAAAVDSSTNHQLRQCGDLLARAEQHTRRAGYLRSVSDRTQPHTTGRVPLRLLSLNNLACYHKQVGKPLAAIGFLEEALEIQLRQRQDEGHDAASVATDPDDSRESAIALTHLNLSAVLSQMTRHDAAAEHARNAIELLHQASARGEPIDANLLVVAHYNLAVEAEHLGDANHVRAALDKGLAAAQLYGVASDTHDVVRLLEEMRRTTERVKSPRRAVAPVLRPPSPRTLRQRGW